MMRWVADENFPETVIFALRSAGHDVLSIVRTAPGLPDVEVLALCRQEGRGLLTFDADFGDLVFFHGVEPPPAILYFRIHPIVADVVLAAALRAIAEVPAGSFAVIGSDSIRLRRLRAEGAGG